MPIDGLFRTTLSNGLQLILRPSRAAPVASFWVFYRVGSRNEVPGLTGISHWVEHMLFKGTELYPPGAFDRAIARAGGVANGMTWQDGTAYFETLPSDRIELALQVESDRMANALFDPEETEAERAVIISEREGSENSEAYRLQEELQSAAFTLHSYGHPIIGWKSDLQAITRGDLLRHYQTFYTPSNAIAVATGDFDVPAMVERIEQIFGAIPPGPEPSPTHVREPVQQSERRVLLRGDDPTGYFMQAFHVPEATHADFFPLVVLDSVLSGAKGMGIFGGSANSRSNRLYQALVETQVTVDATSNYGPTIDPGLFTVSATLAPGATHDQVEEIVWQELAKVQQQGVTPAEIAKAIKQTRAQFAYSSESVTYQAYWLGFSEIIASLSWLDSWVEQLEAVTVDDVQRVAQIYFTRNNQTVGWYLPREQGGEEGDA